MKDPLAEVVSPGAGLVTLTRQNHYSPLTAFASRTLDVLPCRGEVFSYPARYRDCLIADRYTLCFAPGTEHRLSRSLTSKYTVPFYAGLLRYLVSLGLWFRNSNPVGRSRILVQSRIALDTLTFKTTACSFPNFFAYATGGHSMVGITYRWLHGRIESVLETGQALVHLKG